jgi:hypothetical protein
MGPFARTAANELGLGDEYLKRVFGGENGIEDSQIGRLGFDGGRRGDSAIVGFCRNQRFWEFLRLYSQRK